MSLVLQVTDQQWLSAYSKFRESVSICGFTKKHLSSFNMLQKQSKGSFIRSYKILLLSYELTEGENNVYNKI